MSTTIERVRLFAAVVLAGLGLILTAALTPNAVRPLLGPAPARGAAMALAVQAQVDDDPQELRDVLACMFGLASVNEHTVLMLEGEQAGTVNGALFDTDAGAFVTPIAPLNLLWVDPIAFDVPPIDLGAEGLLQSRWKMGVIDLGTASSCGPFVVGLMICLDGTCPDASTATMVLFAPSGFHATYSGALEEAVAAKGAGRALHRGGVAAVAVGGRIRIDPDRADAHGHPRGLRSGGVRRAGRRLPGPAHLRPAHLPAAAVQDARGVPTAGRSHGGTTRLQ